MSHRDHIRLCLRVPTIPIVLGVVHRCNELTRAEKDQFVGKWPKVLTFHLKGRFISKNWF